MVYGDGACTPERIATSIVSDNLLGCVNINYTDITGDGETGHLALKNMIFTDKGFSIINDEGTFILPYEWR